MQMTWATPIPVSKKVKVKVAGKLFKIKFHISMVVLCGDAIMSPVPYNDALRSLLFSALEIPLREHCYFVLFSGAHSDHRYVKFYFEQFPCHFKCSKTEKYYNTFTFHHGTIVADILNFSDAQFCTAETMYVQESRLYLLVAVQYA